MQVRGAIWVRATWIIAFLEAIGLVMLFVLKVGQTNITSVLWAFLFVGPGIGVLCGHRRSARWLMIVQ